MVICLKQGADLHMAQLMPLLLAVSCFSNILTGLPFWYRMTQVVPEKGPLNGCVCVTSVVNRSFASGRQLCLVGPTVSEVPMRTLV